MNWDYEASLRESFSEFERDIPALDRIIGEEVEFAEQLRREMESNLPAIETSDSLADQELPLPPEIIKGFLHQGLKGVLGSSSKARKTWILLNLGISVSEGVDFWQWQTVKGKVLYINFEIPRAFMRSRIIKLRECMGISSTPNLHVWNLRGYAAPLWKLLEDFISRIKREKYILVIIDPIYKSLGDRVENAAEDVAQVCNEMERIAVEADCAVVYAAHFSKGNQSGKEAIDRISGSGVWARDADSLMIMTKHEADDCYTVETVLRNLPEQPNFVVRWQYPVMSIDTELDPKCLKKTTGRPKTHNENDVWKLLDTQLTTTEWEDRAKSELGVGRTQFFAIKKQLQSEGRILLSKINGKWVQVTPREV